MSWKTFAADTTIKLKPSDLNLSSGAPKAVGAGQIEGVLMTVYAVAGIVAVVAIIFGGIRYVGSNGDSSQITGAKNTILYAVIGLIVAILAYAIVNFVLERLG